jgi:hypothetical protein
MKRDVEAQQRLKKVSIPHQIFESFKRFRKKFKLLSRPVIPKKTIHLIVQYKTIILHCINN